MPQTSPEIPTERIQAIKPPRVWARADALHRNPNGSHPPASMVPPPGSTRRPITVSGNSGNSADQAANNLDHLSNDAENFGGLMTEVRIN